MKGKGKKNRDSSDEESNSCPLMFIDFKSLDHSRTCPRYTSVLNRSEEQSIGLEDLDPLQLELEELLVSVIQRQKEIQSEMDSLVNWQDVKAKEKKFSPSKASSESSGKRSKQIDDRPSKKIKDSSSSSSSSSSYSIASTSSSSTSIAKNTNTKSKSKNIKIQEYDHIDNVSDLQQVIHIRNDVPDKFWSFVDGYCSPVKAEHIQYLENLLKNYEDESDYYKIPNLGKHYTIKWAQEDESENKNDDLDKNSINSNESKKKGLSPSNLPLNERKSGKKNKNNKNDSDKCPFGTLTQRLVSCLFEESLLTNSMDLDINFDNDASKNGFQLDKNLFKGINFGNTGALEKRIKKELEENGFLDSDLFSNDLLDDEDDEVYTELVKAQTELKAISAQNEAMLKDLLEKAKNQRKEDELNKKLVVVENEIIDAYKRILSARQKKRSPTKKERDLALKALKERELLIHQMNTI